MNKFFIICFLLVFTNSVKAQVVSCEKLMEYVQENGTKTGNVSALSLMYSTWLKDVTAYTIEDKIVVIAEIKKDEYGLSTKKYIFCGIPKQNWENFYWGVNDFGKSYGERFNKYIMDYRCNYE